MPYKDPAQERAYRRRRYAIRGDEVRAVEKRRRAARGDAIRARQRKNYAEHGDEIRAKERTYYAEHRDEIRAKKRNYYAGHSEAMREVKARYTTLNRERIKQRDALKRERDREARRQERAIYLATHPDEVEAIRVSKRAKFLEQKKASYRRNREASLARRRKAYLLRREKICAEVKDYRERNPHMVFKFNAVRRMRVEATIENEHAIRDFVKLIRGSKTVVCYYCKKAIPGKGAHIDHVVPLARNGKHEAGNLCVSCQLCNNTKHAKLLSEWKREGQQVLPI